MRVPFGRASRGEVLWFTALLVLGCVPDESVPDAAVITCQLGDTCPAGFVCRERIGRCVQGDIETIPPEVLSPRVAPAVGRAGTRIVVTFDSSEALTEAPRVYANLVSSSVDLTRLDAGSTGNHHAFELVADDGQPEGLAKVYADLVDLAGNVATGKSVGTFSLDFTPPGLLGQPAILRSDFLSSANLDGGVVLSLRPADGYAGVPEASLNFTVTEELSGPPEVSVGSALAVLVERRGNSWAYRYRPTGAEAEAPTEVRAMLEDVAGNRATVSLGVLGFDFSPAGPFDPAAVRYTLNPPEGVFQLNAAAAAFGPGERVRVYLQADDGGYSRVAETVAESSGAFSGLAVPSAPGYRLFVGRVDPAGNESSPQEVKTLEWIASFAGKASGGSNPHSAWHVDASPLRAASRERGELLDVEYLALQGAGWTSAGAPGLWTTCTTPNKRINAGLTWDSRRGRSVFFGGGAANYTLPYDDTWLWDGTSWQSLALSVRPPPGFALAYAYDPVRDVVVLVDPGASRNTTAVLETWEFDGARWTRIPTSGPHPPWHGLMSMAYDGLRARMVLVTQTTLGAQTWEWDGQRWSQSGGPQPSHAGPVVFDARRGTLVLLAQTWETVSTPAPIETWERPLPGSGWVKRSSPHAPPPSIPGSRPTLLFDALRQRVLSSGGGGSGGSSLGPGVWAWSGTDWARVADTNPPVEGAAAATFDQRQGVVVTHGGQWGGGCCGGNGADLTVPYSTYADWWYTYQLTEGLGLDGGAGWGLVVGRPCDGTLSGTPVVGAFDSARRTMVAFANDTLATNEWDGYQWKQAATTLAPPALTSMAYDPRRRVTVGFVTGTTLGASGTQIWELSGGTWRLANFLATDQTVGAATYDPRLGAVVVSIQYPSSSANAALQGLWSWNGAVFRRSGPSSAPSPTIVYDEPAWGAVSWASSCSAGLVDGGTVQPPLARPYGAVAYDSRRNRVVCTDAVDINGATRVRETWELDLDRGVAENRSGPSDPPLKGASYVTPLLLYDASRSESLRINDQGTYRWTQAALPALSLRASVEGVASARDLALPPCAGRSLELRAIAGGLSDTGPGVVAEVWDRTLNGFTGGWRTLASTGASTSAPTPLAGVLDGAAVDGAITGEVLQVRLRPSDRLTGGAVALAVKAPVIRLVCQRP